MSDGFGPVGAQVLFGRGLGSSAQDVRKVGSALGLKEPYRPEEVKRIEAFFHQYCDGRSVDAGIQAFQVEAGGTGGSKTKAEAQSTTKMPDASDQRLAIQAILRQEELATQRMAEQCLAIAQQSGDSIVDSVMAIPVLRRMHVIERLTQIQQLTSDEQLFFRPIQALSLAAFPGAAGALTSASSDHQLP